MTVIERIELQGRGKQRQEHELGALGFQRWLEQWRGQNVRVLISQDGTHAVAVTHDNEGARMATAEKTAPWQAQIIQELEQKTADELGDHTHAIIWIRENGNATLISLAESEDQANTDAAREAVDVESGEVTVANLDDLQGWIEHHGDEMLPIAGADIETDETGGDDTDEDFEPEEDDGSPLAGDGDDLPIAGTATGPDPESGQLFDVPRATIEIDETDPTVIKVTFSGGVELDRAKPDDVKFFNSLKDGKTASLNVDVHVAGTKTTHRRDSEGNVDAVVKTKSLIVHSIDEAA